MEDIRKILKDLFQHRSKPTKEHFHLWLDSFILKGGDDGIFLDNNGNLGIGTKAPERALHILGTGGPNDDIAVESQSNDNSGSLIFDRSRVNLAAPGPEDSLGIVLFRGKISSNGTRRAASIEAVAESNFNESVNGSLRFKTNNNGNKETERMRIDGNGNVGIGTVPDAKLHIVTEGVEFPGAVLKLGPKPGSTLENNDTAELKFGYYNDYCWINSHGRGSKPLHINSGENGGNDVIMNLNGGKVGIGTASPEGILHIVAKTLATGTGAIDSNGNVLTLGPRPASTSENNAQLRLGYSDTYSWIQSHGSKPLRINEEANDVIMNLKGGNVGIGIGSPRAKLHVNGPIRIQSGEHYCDIILHVETESSPDGLELKFEFSNGRFLELRTNDGRNNVRGGGSVVYGSHE